MDPKRQVLSRNGPAARWRQVARLVVRVFVVGSVSGSCPFSFLCSSVLVFHCLYMFVCVMVYGVRLRCWFRFRFRVHFFWVSCSFGFRVGFWFVFGFGGAFAFVFVAVFVYLVYFYFSLRVR